MSLEQVLKETRDMPRQQIAELIDKLTLELQETMEISVEKLWRRETQSRIAEVKNSSVQGIPEKLFRRASTNSSTLETFTFPSSHRRGISQQAVPKDAIQKYFHYSNLFC